MALALAQAGADVLITGRDAHELDKTRDEGGGRIESLVVDVTADDAPQAIVGTTIERFGGLDILVNNAGITVELLRRQSGAEPPTTFNLTADEFRRVLEVNTIAPFLISRAAVEPMRKRGGGRIVNVTTSLDTMWRKGLIPYGGSKAANEAHCVALAHELWDFGITVNVLTPGGPADTQMIAPGVERSALIQAEVMAAPLLWLTSSEAANVTATRVIAALWRTDVTGREAARWAAAPAAWQSLGSQAMYPQGYDGDQPASKP
jgi:NAD(P)-dependent dehydrogenase (short-subunit alcohol dehydrogenase family)